MPQPLFSEKKSEELTQIVVTRDVLIFTALGTLFR